jgi:hypothetical protein
MTVIEIISLAGSLIGLGCGVTALASTFGLGFRVSTLEQLQEINQQDAERVRGAVARTPNLFETLGGVSINLPHVPDDWKAGDR